MKAVALLLFYSGEAVRAESAERSSIAASIVACQRLSLP